MACAALSTQTPHSPTWTHPHSPCYFVLSGHSVLDGHSALCSVWSYVVTKSQVTLPCGAWSCEVTVPCFILPHMVSGPVCSLCPVLCPVPLSPLPQTLLIFHRDFEIHSPPMSFPHLFLQMINSLHFSKPHDVPVPKVTHPKISEISVETACVTSACCPLGLLAAFSCRPPTGD